MVRTQTARGDYQLLWHTYTLRLLSLASVKTVEESQEKGTSLIEADRHQSPGWCEDESWRSEPHRSGGRTLSSCMWLSACTPFLTDNTLIVSPSLSPSFLHLSPASETAPLYFFLAAFTNGLVTMEIAAHENLTYSGWEHKFQTFCCGIHPSSCAFQSYYAH